MSNPITNIIRDKLIRPEVERETKQLKHQLELAKSNKQFELVNYVQAKFGVSSKSNVTSNWIRHYSSWIYANAHVQAVQVANINLEVYKYKKSGKSTEVEELPTHPVLELLLRINDFQTKYDLFYTYQIHRKLLGEAAWYLVGMRTPASKPTEIWPLNPEYLKVVPGDLSKNEFVKEYTYRIPGKEEQTFKPFEIIHFKSPHPTNLYRGYGILEAIMSDILIDESANNYNEKYFRNDARPDGILKTDQRLTDDTFNRVKSQFENKYRGTDNAGKTAILEQGLDYKIVSESRKDMDFLEQQRWTRDKIMAAFGNTKTALGITEDVNRANAEASEYSWLKHTIKPELQRLVDDLNEKLMPLFDSNAFLGFEDPLPESRDQKIAEFEKGVDKWLTRNEIREQLGLETVEGGDYLYVGLSSTPVGEDKNQDNSSQNNDSSDNDNSDGEQRYFRAIKVVSSKGKRLAVKFAKEVAALENKKERDENLKKTINKVFKSLVIPQLASKLKGLKSDGTFTDEAKKANANKIDRIALAFEKQIYKLIQTIIGKHRDETVRLIGTYGGKSIEKGINDMLPDEEKYIKLTIDALAPLLKILVEEQGNNILDSLNIDKNFNVTKEILKAIDRFALKSGKSYVGTLTGKIKQALKDGIEAGEGIADLQKRIRGVYPELTKLEAERIARTESIRAANYATEEAFIQSGVVTGKQWVTGIDERVCPFCGELDGKVYDLNEVIFDEGSTMAIGDKNLDITYDDVAGPPLHVGCRCTLSPVVMTSRSRDIPKGKVIANKTVAKPVVTAEPVVHPLMTEEKINELLDKKLDTFTDGIIEAIQNGQ